MVALRAALSAPARVAGLMLLDTHAGPETTYKKLKYRALRLGVRGLGIGPWLPALLPLFFGRSTMRSKPELIAEDVSLPPEDSRQIAAGVPGATLIEIQGAGHLSALKQPTQVTEAMLAFLDAHALPGGTACNRS